MIESAATGYNLNIGARPNQPYPKAQNYDEKLDKAGAGAAFIVTTAYHHIIPFASLSAFLE